MVRNPLGAVTSLTSGTYLRQLAVSVTLDGVDLTFKLRAAQHTAPQRNCATRPITSDFYRATAKHMHGIAIDILSVRLSNAYIVTKRDNC